MPRELPDRLDPYRGKRDPDRTPEPFGGTVRSAGRLFVVHLHGARRLHYDLRLEIDGALKSWAVPKGPSTRVEEKRLAVHVEDHPIEYGDFEGVIPAGNYGAGPTILWDRGWFRSFKDDDLLTQYRRGRLELEFFGFKMRGRWTLVRTARGAKDWLLLKKAGAGASDVELTERYPESVVSGLRLDEIGQADDKRRAVAQVVEALGAPRRDVVLRGTDVMLATLARAPFDGRDWVFEAKYDGVRVLARRSGGDVSLAGRNGQDYTARYPEIVEALRALPHDDFVIDGEIIATDESGRPSFQRLQARLGLTRPADVARARESVPVSAVFFDALALCGFDLRRVALVERKRCLALVLPPLGVVRYGGHVEEHGVRMFEAASELGLEGIVAKRAASLYIAGRTREWIKIKCQRRQEFVIGGWTDPRGSRAHFGALHVGLYDGPRLVYVTKVGTGFDEETQRRLFDRLQALASETSPFAEGTPAGRGHHWIEPRLVCEVRFADWTEDGGLRHSTFLGLREDVRPEDCRREEPAPAAAESGPDTAPAGAAAAMRARAEERVVRLTNLDKVFWPSEGYTKGDLIAYYDAVAPHLLPYLAERPLFITRYPDGITGKSFYQKDAPGFTPSWVRAETVYSGGDEREIRYFVIDDADMLRYVVNLGAIPLHPWSSRLGSLERPDWMILDLDPKGAPFTHVVRLARVIHRLLDGIEVPSYVKTSGATGLHVLVPLGARYTYEQSRLFAKLLATLVVEAEPEIATIARPLHAREGKVYVDFGQNGHGQTIVAPYSVRALPGAPVSCPLRWNEVTARLDPARFTIRTALRRFEKTDDPLRGVLGDGIRIDRALERLGERLTESGDAPR